ncbi:MAG: tRNA epoxyqueuosine(34) reductase QueG [Gemmatimonadetes bacterium]|nr:tRNA epoxyqueuosine(34) reductase QueG [Gemmatimonadota bacterium]NNM04012.1 tRNA epoxyqueuosine(34) reductase QueG [Gemmatimonadota bacterium]
MDRLVRDLRREGIRLGFQDLRICAPRRSEHIRFFREWIDQRFHGEMSYLSRPDSVARRDDLRGTLEDVRSVVVVTQNYFQPDSPGVPGDPARGVVARYARGEDYHELLKGRLQVLLRWLDLEAGKRRLAGKVRGLAYVDTGPILERELGRLAGLGWFGKNTMLIHPKRGSYFFLGVLLLDLPLQADPTFGSDHCGTCRACLDACPTGALLGKDQNGAPVMDARRCISYLTIELKGPIPRGLRPGIGNRIFGCDICQEVCPWNGKFAETSSEAGFRSCPDTDGPGLVQLMGLSDDEFGSRFSSSPIKRAKRRGFLRNVAVALGNWGSRDAVPALARALDDPEPLVRGHAAWALGQILNRVGIPGDGGFEVAEALLFRLNVEDDPWVEGELEAGLKGE